MRTAVFLDRDGVLSIPLFRDGRSYAPRSLADFALYDDAPQAVTRLKQAGFLVIVVTNQPDVGAGLVDATVVEAMHSRLRTAVAVDDIEVCYETRDQATERRKPGAGMLRDAAAKWSIDLARSFMVGDRASDVEAAERAGVVPVFIDLGYEEPRPVAQQATVASLREAVEWILAQRGPGQTQREHSRANETAQMGG